MRFLALCSALLVSAPAYAQIFTFTREQMIKYTPNNPFDRFPDGRPKVPDELLERLRPLTQENVWGMLGKEFPNQFEGNWRVIQPGKKLVGRAVTAQYMPFRGDLSSVAEAEARARGAGAINQRVIDMLQPGDVLVVDLFGKVEQGTFVGDNLAMAIYGATKAGFVIDGSMRDLDGIYEIGVAGYVRNFHPSAIGNVILTAVNTPVRIGSVTVMPGDVVLGDREGVTFIPPQFVQKIVERGEETLIHDEWTKAKFLTGKYKSSELYPSPKDPELRKEYEEYKKARLKK